MIRKQIIIDVYSNDKGRVDTFIVRFNHFIRKVREVFNLEDTPADNHLYLDIIKTSIPEKFHEFNEEDIDDSISTFVTVKVK